MSEKLHPCYRRHLSELGTYELLIRNSIMDHVKRNETYSTEFDDLLDEYNEIRSVSDIFERCTSDIIYLIGPHLQIVKNAVEFVATHPN